MGGLAGDVHFNSDLLSVHVVILSTEHTVQQLGALDLLLHLLEFRADISISFYHFPGTFPGWPEDVRNS